jgi:3-oxosteroid 1-dehydrogenase
MTTTEQLTEDVFERSADVIVVGSGAAGCAAMATAAREGAEVLLVERADGLGGTTALSGAGAWIPNNTLMRAEGVEDPKEPALRYMAWQAYPQLYNPEHPTLGMPADVYALMETFYDNGPAAIDYLMEMGAADFYADMELPDYYAEHPDNRAPYGRKISPQARKVSHAAAGPSLIDQMTKAAGKLGASVVTNHRVMSLLRNADGEVVGVEARTGRRTVLLRARRAVVFATGGFLHDPDMAREFLIGPVFGGCAVPTSTGDFVRIGIEAGAQLGNMGHAWWYQICLEHAAGHGHTAGGLFMPFGDSMIQVNRHGRRVMNEKAPYNERGPVHFAWDGREYSNLLLFSIYDDGVAQNPDPIGHRWPIPMPGEEVRYILKGDTLEELAAKLDERLAELKEHTGGVTLGPEFVANLRATIERYNGFARTGEDLDFDRGSSAIAAYWSGEPRPGARNTMHEFLDHGPYYSMILVAGALDTKGGPKTNTKSQVLNTHGEPIPGLYGAGNCVASPAGQAYWGPGGTIGPAIAFGWIAGLNAAKEPEKVL